VARLKPFLDLTPVESADIGRHLLRSSEMKRGAESLALWVARAILLK
jgi:hypothetical protein